MSRGANPVVAAAFGLAALLTAGVASADCASHQTNASTTQSPASDTVAKPDAGGSGTRSG